MGSKILLRLSGDASDASSITYSGHANAGPWVTNEAGVGLLTFAHLPIEKAAPQPK